MQRKQRHVLRNLLILFSILACLGILYFLTDYRENQKIIATAKYQLGEQVEVEDKIGVVSQIKANRLGFSTNKELTYSIRFSNFEDEFETTEGSLSQDLDTLYHIGQVVEVYDEESDQYEINAIKQAEDGSFVYTLLDSKGNQKDSYSQDDLTYILNVPLAEENTAAENNQALQEAINESTNYAHTILEFPEGKYTIGTDNPEEEYILLASNIEMRSNNTTLVVAGSSRWFALATGPGATEGVSNFSMHGFDVISNDLENGSQFIIMANHGENWELYDNVFTLVHQKASHIVDLGGVQNGSFYNNKFVGYAPDLTDVDEIGDNELHDFYAEAIQTDYAHDNEVWDGGMLAAIDEDYYVNNPEQVLSGDIEIYNNELLPYYDNEGAIVAYAATLGQHSSKVDNLSITNNVITDPLVYNYDVDTDKYWYFTPVHAQSDTYLTLEPNNIKTS